MTKAFGLSGIVKKTFAIPTCTTLKARAYRDTVINNNALISATQAVSALDADSPNIDMGKSNKFDFTNRKNSGVDLGQSIGRSLVKESEKLQKDAEKAAAKARKQSSSSSVGTSETSQDVNAHLVSLQAPAKNLGDDGFDALADGLETALKNGTAQASLALEDLDLSGNGLSTASLARLAPIIELAKHDLKTINLANNNISIITDEQSQQWELFLSAFGGCFKLRRLDLSGNRELGDRAYEVFARVYISESPVTPMRPYGDGSVLSLVSEHHHEDEISEAANENATEADALPTNNVLESGRFLRRRCGLRSIPYITLHETGLTNAGALWLSYVLEEHHYPIQLTDELNATPASIGIRTYQQGAGLIGLDWSENQATLGKDGLFLLQKTETVRRHLLLDDQSTLAESILTEDVDSVTGDSLRVRKASIGHMRSRSPPGNRRASMRSIRTVDGGEHEASELESARKKIQRHVIDHDKVKSVDLWYAGLKLVAASRIICWAAPTTRKYYTGVSLFEIGAPDGHISHTGAPSSTTASTNTKQGSRADSPVHESYAAKLIVVPNNGTVGNPEIAITEVTNSPITPKIVFKPHRKGAFSEGTDMPAVTEKLNGLIVRDHNPARFVRYQQRRIDEAPAGLASYRDFEVASHLPEEIMEYIMTFVMSEEERRVLSGEQARAVVAWGQDRATLRTELEWRKRDESFQVWMLLDGVKCLAYGQ